MYVASPAAETADKGSQVRDRIARRAAKEFKDGMYVNLGIGKRKIIHTYIHTYIQSRILSYGLSSHRGSHISKQLRTSWS